MHGINERLRILFETHVSEIALSLSVNFFQLNAAFKYNYTIFERYVVWPPQDNTFRFLCLRSLALSLSFGRLLNAVYAFSRSFANYLHCLCVCCFVPQERGKEKEIEGEEREMSIEIKMTISSHRSAFQ